MADNQPSGYEMIHEPNADGPMKAEIMRRLMFVADLADSMEGTLMPMSAMRAILAQLEEIEAPEQDSWMPILVEMTPVACVVYKTETASWYIVPMIRKRPGMSVLEATQDLHASLLADQLREQVDEALWPQP